MNKCRHIRKNIINLVEEKLSSQEHAEIMEHIASCSECQILVNQIRNTYLIFDDKNGQDPGPFFHTRVTQRLSNKLVNVGTQYNRVMQPIAICLLTAAGMFSGVIIGRNISEISLNAAVSSNNEVLKSYANDYFLNGTGDESLEILVNNE